MKCEAYLVGRGLLVVMLIVLLTNRKDYELFLSDVVFAFDGEYWSPVDTAVIEINEPGRVELEGLDSRKSQKTRQTISKSG